MQIQGINNYYTENAANLRWCRFQICRSGGLQKYRFVKVQIAEVLVIKKEGLGTLFSYTILMKHMRFNLGSPKL